MLEHNVEGVLTRVREIAHSRGVGIIYVSHKMPEVMSVSDKVVVLRDGGADYTTPIVETSEQDIVRNMVGRELLSFKRQHPVPPGRRGPFRASEVSHPSGGGPSTRTYGPAKSWGSPAWSAQAVPSSSVRSFGPTKAARAQ